MVKAPKARPAPLPPLPGTGPAMPKTLPGLPPAATPGPRKLLTSARPWGWLAGAKGITGPLPKL